MASDGTQKELRLAFGVHRAPVDAPEKVLRQIKSEAQALAVSMKAGGHKCASIGAAIGKSEGYVSRLRSGKRLIPDTLVDRLCAATGSNLLRQYIEREGEDCPVERLASMLRAA